MAAHGRVFSEKGEIFISLSGDVREPGESQRGLWLLLLVVYFAGFFVGRFL